MNNLLFIDVEATGLDPEDRLVEVAYVKDNAINQGYFKAPLPVKLGAMSINNITNEMLADKQPFIGSETYSELASISSDSILVAHNAIYDLEMLKKEGLEFKKHICTMKIAHYLDEKAEMEKHTLSYLRYFLGVKVDATPHTAIGDITILEAIFETLLNTVSERSNITKDEAIVKMVEISNQPILHKKFTFGKYNGLSLLDVAQNRCPDGKGRDYLKWLLSQKISNPSGQEVDWIYTLNYYLNAYEPVSR